MNFGKFIPHVFKHEVAILLREVERRNWTVAKSLIKQFCVSKIWLKGYALLESVFNDHDRSLAVTVVELISHFDGMVCGKEDEFTLLEGVFQYALRTQKVDLISKLFTIGLPVNSSFENRSLLCEAIFLNVRLDIISEMISQGACVNLAGPDLITPLATMMGTGSFDADLAELLLTFGANVNLTFQGPLSKSLVHLACETGNSEGLEWLLSCGADVNVQSADGDTCIHTAVRQRNLTCIRSLLHHGVSANKCNKKGETLLYIAVSQNDTETAYLLLQNGAGVDCDLNKALRVAIKESRNLSKVCIFEFLQNYTFVTVNVNDLSFAHDAAQHGHLCIITKFLELGGSPNSTYNQTPLLLDAISSKRKEIVEILLKYGCDTAVTDPFGKTALFVSVSSNLPAITELLLSNGCKINDGSHFDYICIAADSLDLETIKHLLKFGANVNTQNSIGLSPLHIAIISDFHTDRDLEIVDSEKAKAVKFLLTHGAELDSQSATEHLCFAISSNYRQVVTVLLESVVSMKIHEKHEDSQFLSTVLHFAIRFKFNEMIEVLLQNGVPVNGKQNDGKTPLQLAVELSDAAVVRTLLKNGANANSITTSKEYMISHAIQNSCSSVVAELLEFGADVETRDHSESTALQKACQRLDGKMVATLLEYGADINVVDSNGCTPYMMLKPSCLETMQVCEWSLYGYENSDNAPCSCQVMYRLEIQVLKMALVGLPLDPCYKPLLELAYNNDDLRICKKELGIMKKTKISGHLSPYDMIKKKRDPVFVKNKDFVRKLKDKSVLEKFVELRGVLRYCLKKSKERFKLLGPASSWFSDELIVTDLPSLPPEVVRRILSFLTTKELEFLMRKI